MTVCWYDTARSSFDLLGPDSAHGRCVAVRRQSAGRGQRGNSWESEAGANLTFSLMLRPKVITPQRQYELSMSVATSVCRVLRDCVDKPELLCLKWPNDIYYGDRKLGGILIEQVLSGGGIERSAVGIGINVNQRRFLSDAPNPVSLFQVTGRELSLELLLLRLHATVMADFDRYEQAGAPGADLLARYRAMLWRGTGFHPYIDTASGERFDARIHDILPHGPIVLQLPDQSLRTYFFKEVQAVLKP